MKKIALTEDMDPVLRVRTVREQLEREFPTIEAWLNHLDSGEWRKGLPTVEDARRLGITSPWETMFDDEKPARSRKGSASARKPRATRRSKPAVRGEKDKGSSKSSSKR
jgi:hypothetical protein